MPDFYTVVTDTGLQALGLASTQGQSFSLTQAVVGDGNGLAVIPNKGMTSLVNEVWRGNVAGIKVDPDDPNTFIFEFAIPADTGGFTIREVGLLDDNDKLFCIGNFPDTEKPVAVNGSVRDLVVRLPLHFENAEVVNLVIDAAIALATKQDVADHNADPHAHQLATTAQTGFVRLATVEEHKAKSEQNIACTPFGVWELLKSLMSSAYTSTSTAKLATSKAVNDVYKKVTAHLEDTTPHDLPLNIGEAGQVLIKQEDGSIAWGTVAGVPVGELCFSTNGEALPGTVPANVKQKVRCNLYPQLFEWMKGGAYLTDEAAWDAEAAAQDGTCGKYCWDGGEYFILPCYTKYFAAAHAGKDVGSWDGDAIRNITGRFGGVLNASGDGAFKREEFKEVIGVSGASSYYASFDASRVVPTAEENRPKTAYVLPCIKAFDIAINAAQIDMQALAQQVAAINGNKVDRSEWAKLAFVPAGHIYPVPFPPNEFPEDHYVPNGEGLLKTSEAGKTLLSMSTAYKAAHRVTENETHVFLPNVFDVNGDGFFPRFVDGANRMVGSVQLDAIRNITGYIDSVAHGYSFGASAGGAFARRYSTDRGNATSTGATEHFDFDASLVVPTALENRPKNYGFIPAIYLPPLEA